eukprot:2917936-Rhodomonas_salina.1
MLVYKAYHQMLLVQIVQKMRFWEVDFALQRSLTFNGDHRVLFVASVVALRLVAAQPMSEPDMA